MSNATTHTIDNAPLLIEEVAHHRNGIMGDPFYAVTFKWQGACMVAIRFDADTTPCFGQPHTAPRVAVLNVELLAKGIVTFGENSYRGDEFVPAIEEAIAQYEADYRFTESQYGDVPSEDDAGADADGE